MPARPGGTFRCGQSRRGAARRARPLGVRRRDPKALGPRGAARWARHLGVTGLDSAGFHENEEELFWAMRGGGGNFGVVTAMRLELHRLPSVRFGHAHLPVRRGQGGPRRLRRDRQVRPGKDLVDVRLLGERHPIRVVPRAGDDLVESPEALIRLAPPASGGEFAHHVVELHAQERVGDGMELRRRQLGARCLSDPVPELPAGLVRRLRVGPDVLRREEGGDGDDLRLRGHPSQGAPSGSDSPSSAPRRRPRRAGKSPGAGLPNLRSRGRARMTRST